MAARPDAGRRLAIGLAFLLLAGAATLSWRLDAMAQRRGEVRYDVPRADVMQAIATGFDNALADAYWLQFLQYDGEKLTEEQTNRRFEHLWDGVALITGLDAHFEEAYLFGSWVLGDAGQAEQADRLLRSALQHDRRWPRFAARPRYYLQLGFIRFLYEHDWPGATVAFQTCARQAMRQGDPRLATTALRMTAGMAERSHRFDLERAVWHTLLSQALKAHNASMVTISRRALAKLGG
ncbi:MAG: hypothetical protein KGR26_13370 [Cyanobacteria bacterium REEB65]|nr:hypothetical protein [Cyanobacteria bacterium REEB65]